MSFKYVKVNYQGDVVIFPFPKLVQHSDFIRSMKIQPDDILSAGFIRMNKNAKDNLILTCFGKSISLRKGSDEEDSRLATRQHYSEMDMDDFEYLWNEQ